MKAVEHDCIRRLLLHAMLLRKHFPAAVIRPERKTAYYSTLNVAQKNRGTLAARGLPLRRDF